MVVRWIAALIAFLAVVVIGIVGIGNFDTGIDPDNFFDTEGANSFALIGAIGARRGVRRLRGRRVRSRRASFASISSQFDTRTLVLMPIAIAINIILGATVANALKIPIYLDSIGTILVAALAGPIAGRADRCALEPHLDLRPAAAVPERAGRGIRRSSPPSSA